jgi:hypothetical protein
VSVNGRLRKEVVANRMTVEITTSSWARMPFAEILQQQQTDEKEGAGGGQFQ